MVGPGKWGLSGPYEEEPVRGGHLFGDIVAAPLGAFGPLRGGLEPSGSAKARGSSGEFGFSDPPP